MKMTSKADLEDQLLAAEDMIEDVKKALLLALDVLDDIDKLINYDTITTLAVRRILDNAFHKLKELDCDTGNKIDLG
jgi:hypothetical protein